MGKWLPAAALALALAVTGCNAVSQTGGHVELVTVAKQMDWTFLFALPDAQARLAILGFDRTHHLRVAFVREGRRNVLSQTGLEVTDIAWTPQDGLLVALGNEETPAELALMDPEDGSIERRIEVGWNRVVDPHSMSVSPDGAKAVIAGREPGPTESASHLFLVDLSNGDADRIGEASGLFEESPTFVDSGTIAYVQGESTFSAGVPNGIVRTLDLETGESRAVSPASFVAGSVNASADSGDLVYDAFPSGDRASQAVWLVMAGEREQVELLEGPYSFPALSQAGKLLVVTNTSFGEIQSGEITD